MQNFKHCIQYDSTHVAKCWGVKSQKVIVWYENGACSEGGYEQQDYTCPLLCVREEYVKEVDFIGPSTGICMF